MDMERIKYYANNMDEGLHRTTLAILGHFYDMMEDVVPKSLIEFVLRSQRIEYSASSWAAAGTST